MNHPAIVTGTVTAEPDPAGPVTDEPVRCPKCGRTIAWQATRPWRIRCRSCKVDVTAPAVGPLRTEAL